MFGLYYLIALCIVTAVHDNRAAEITTQHTYSTSSHDVTSALDELLTALSDLITTFEENIVHTEQGGELTLHEIITATNTNINNLISTYAHEAIGHHKQMKDRQTAREIVTSFLRMLGNLANIIANPKNAENVHVNAAGMIAQILNIAETAKKTGFLPDLPTSEIEHYVRSVMCEVEQIRKHRCQA